MKWTKIVGALGFLVGFCCLAAFASPAGASQPSSHSAARFSIVLTGPASPIPINGPVRVTVTIINITDKPLWWDMRYIEPRYLLKRNGQKIERAFPNGRVTGRARRDHPSVNSNEETVVVSYPPGKMFGFQLDLKRLYKITKPGLYTFQMNEYDVASKALVKSNTVTITVTKPSQTPQPQAAATSYVLAIGTLNNPVKAASGIKLEINVTNTSSHPIDYDPSITEYVIDLRNAHGQPAPLTPAGQKLRKLYGTGRMATFPIPAGKTASAGAIRLNKVYDLSQPGKYTVRVSRFDSETKTWMKSNTITLVVTP